MARKFGIPGSTSPTQRTSSRSNSTAKPSTLVTADVGVIEVFINDDIDFSKESRDFYAEALLEHIDQSMPPILNRMEVPLETLETLEDLVEQANKVIESKPSIVTQAETREPQRTTGSGRKIRNNVPQLEGTRSVAVVTSKQHSATHTGKGRRY